MVTNHPVHIIDEEGHYSPTALIPFCDFGRNMSVMGVKIDQFDDPVCNSFQATIVNDQLCYEVDLNRFSNKNNVEKELKSGFIFMMDYNEDRQVSFEKDHVKVDDGSFANQIMELDDTESAFIYLNTIGKFISFNFIKCTHKLFRTSCTAWRRRV